MLHAVITTLGDVATGSESSPLSPTSQISELLRVMQFAIAAGIWYMIKEMRKNHKVNDHAHDEVHSQVKLIRDELTSMRDEIAEVKSSVGSPIQTTDVSKQ